MIKIGKAFFALTLLVLAVSASVQGQTQTYSLVNGDSLAPASSFIDSNGVKTYFGGFVIGQVSAAAPTTFSFSVAFTEVGPVEDSPGVYSGSIVAPNSSFAVTQSTGRKSVSTSGSIDRGTVFYTLTPEGRAEVVGIQSDSLTVWEGKNKNRRAVGDGTLEYGTVVEGSGTLVLNFF